MKVPVAALCRSFVPALAVMLSLGGCASAPNPQRTASAPWPGKYMQFNGQHDLYIGSATSSDPGWITVDVVTSGHDRNDYAMNASHFLAVIKGEVATSKSLHEEPDCKIELTRTLEGIVINDQCGGTGEDAGLYRPVQ